MSEEISYPALSPAEKGGSQPGVENTVVARQRLLRLQVVLAQLPPKCRQAFLLYNLEKMSYRNIAEHMNLTESRVRKYVLHTLRYCAEKIDIEPS